MTYVKAKVFTLIKMETNTKENFRMMNSMAKAFLLIQMETNIKENLRMAIAMAKVFGPV